MKRFIAIFCILMLLPLYCFAASSPTTGYTRRNVIITPDLMYIKLDLSSVEWERVLEQIQPIIEKNEDFTMLDPIKVCIDKSYRQIEWDFAQEISKDSEAFMLIVGDKVVKHDVKVTADGTFLTDFSDVKYGIYYMIFFVKGA